MGTIVTAMNFVMFANYAKQESIHRAISVSTYYGVARDTVKKWVARLILPVVTVSKVISPEASVLVRIYPEYDKAMFSLVFSGQMRANLGDEVDLGTVTQVTGLDDDTILAAAVIRGSKILDELAAERVKFVESFIHAQ